MPSTDRKTFGTCLRQARLAAGYPSRDLAQDVPISTTCIGRHERGEKTATVSDAIVYAEYYNAPELLIEYCRTVCPIRRYTQPLNASGVAHLCVRLNNTLRSVSEQAERLMRIADDDAVDASERGEFDRIVEQVAALRNVADELEVYALRLRGGSLGQANAAAGKTMW